MDGQIKRTHENDNAFPYKDKDFLLQLQAWWADTTDADTASYMNWIESWGQTLLPFTEGSFINFPDVNLVKNYNMKDGVLDFLKFYYAHILNPLRQIKDKYDKGSLFSIGMSLPPMEVEPISPV